MKIHYATISETGKRRNNEDAFRTVNNDDGHGRSGKRDGFKCHCELPEE